MFTKEQHIACLADLQLQQQQKVWIKEAELVAIDKIDRAALTKAEIAGDDTEKFNAIGQQINQKEAQIIYEREHAEKFVEVISEMIKELEDVGYKDKKEDSGSPQPANGES